MFFNVRDFGAMGDGRNDDLPAFHRALEAMRPLAPVDVGGGGTLLIPAGNYFLNGTLRLKHEVCLTGITGRDGKGAYLPFTVGPDGLPLHDLLPRGVSRLMFPQDVTGIHVAVGGKAEVGSGLGALEHAAGSVLRNLLLVAATGDQNPPLPVKRFGHGISIKGHVIIDNCFIRGFSGNGIHIVAPSSPPPVDDGTAMIDLKCPELGDLYKDNFYPDENTNYPANAIDSHISNTMCRGNGLHGVYVAGSNCGNITFDKVHCIDNGRYGFFDAERSAANMYLGCHSQRNQAGGYYCLSSLVIKDADGHLTLAAKNDTGSIYLSCYQEQAESAPTRIYGPAIIIGGTLGAEGINNTTPDPDLTTVPGLAELQFAPPSIQRQEGRGQAATGFPNGVRAYGGKFNTAPDRTVAVELGGGIENVALAFYENGIAGKSPTRLYHNVPSAPGWWTLSSKEGSAQAPLRFGTDDASWPTLPPTPAGPNLLWLSGGVHLGWLRSAADRPIFVGSAWAPTDEDRWAPGDVLWNLDPKPGATDGDAFKAYAGWVCTAAATREGMRVPTQWAGFGRLEPLVLIPGI